MTKIKLWEINLLGRTVTNFLIRLHSLKEKMHVPFKLTTKLMGAIALF